MNTMIPRASQLNSFTDIFGDDVAQENVSQPISLPSSLDTIPASPTAFGSNNAVGDRNYTKINRPFKHTGQHGEFRSVEEIDPKYRCLFTYPYFNLVQSRIIEDALYSDKSFVLCAPTGSGKTVAFEMAILQILMQNEDTQYTGDFKIIYMAPVKAVCNERLTEWYPKLTKLGLLCIEVTGDTEVDFSQLKPYKVIITTPEKWDMLTRRWRDHRGLVEMIKLFLIDEVHILNDETRGPVLEAVVSRMKTIESAAQSAHRIEQLQKQYQGFEGTTQNSPPHIRFVAVSATVSNPEDVADWLGTNEKPAVFHKFGDECRPVKLKRIVEGYPCNDGTSIFKFDLILNYKLWSIIQKYYNGKPTLIFCNTRKSVALTAEALSREITVTFNPEQKAKLTALASTLKNKKLQMLVMSGVGCHHAGLLFEERVNIERAFRERDLPILITTTTLAMGVNLPAHLVIIKNTQQYVNGAYQEYSITTVLQMVGRAGRPQFDTEATAVIMTRLKDKARYQSLVGGSEPLQSYLHKRIAENLNSEAALGTVTDVAQCVEWLRSTFLYVRAAKDPKRYLGLPSEAPMHLILKKIEELCVKAMNGLASSGLITMDDACCIESTEAGRLMSIFYMDVETMKNIMKIDGTETLERLLWIICESHELSDMHLRVDERRCLNLLNRNNAAATIRYPMKGKISTRQMKLNCIIQAILGCLPIPDPPLNQEAMKVTRIAARVCKCLVKYVSRSDSINQQTQCFSAVLNSIILAKCVQAHLWENSPYVSKQLKGIGPTFSTLLASAGKTSFMLLEESHPRDLERIMNKGPPAGNVLRKQVSLLPKYQLTVTPKDIQSVTVQLMLVNHAYLSENMDQLTAGDSHKSYLIVGDSGNHLLLLALFSDKDLISVYDGTMTYEITRKQSDQHKIIIHCVSSSIAGIDAQAEYLFQDLEPPTFHESDHISFTHQDPIKKTTTKRQTNITDVFKERKRKSNYDVDITQCKEKKKRENALTEKLKALKESFGKTSKEIKKDIDKSTNTSCKLLCELLNNDTGNSTQIIQNIPVKKIECPTVDLTNDAIAEPWEELNMNSDDYEYIDDLQIDSILNKIETEITGRGSVRNLDSVPKRKAEKLAHGNQNDVSKDTNSVSKAFVEPTSYGLGIRKRKYNQPKSNFNVIDLIEKKANTDDTDKLVCGNNDIGFSDTIKCHINKFLERAHGSHVPSTGINDLAHKIKEDMPVVHVKTNYTENDIEQDYDKAKDKESITDAFTKVNLSVNNEPAKNHSEVLVTVDHEQPDTDTSVSQNEPEIIQPICKMNNNQLCDLNNISIKLTEITNNANVDHSAAEQNLSPLRRSGNTSSNDEQNIKLKNVADCSNIIENYEYQADAKFTLVPRRYENTLQPKIKAYKEFKDVTVNYSSENKINQADDQSVIIPIQSENTLVLLDKPYNNLQNVNTAEKKSQILFASDQYENELVPLTIPSDESNNCAIVNSRIENKTHQASAQYTIVPRKTENIMITKSNVDFQDAKLHSYNNGNKNHKTIALNYTVPHSSLRQQYNKEKFIARNSVSSDRSVVIQSNVLLSGKPLPVLQNQAIKRNSHSTNTLPSRNSTSFYESKHFTTERDLEKLQLKNLDSNGHMGDSNSQTKTHFNRYSYTATKIDVRTQNTPDHQLRITRKLKVDLDITEMVTQEKTNVNRKMYTGRENFDDVKLTRKAIVKELSPKEQLEGKFENKTHLLEQNLNETAMITNAKANDKIEGKEKLFHNNNNRETTTNCTEETSVGNILQKYSKILVKSEINPPIINKLNNGKHTCATKTEPQVNAVKTRRPFKIRDIHNMHVALPCTITEAGKIDPSVPLPEPVQPITQLIDKINRTTEIKVEPREIKLEPCEENFNLMPEINENFPENVESPIFTHSLEFEPGENIEDENMFNPKMLLQYFNTGKDIPEIIPPPAEFDDNASYSPDAATDNEFYENLDYNVCSDVEENLDNYNTILESSSYGSRITELPREESMFLSRGDGDTNPTKSFPWVISQSINSGLAARKTRLGQFKFVRKKPMRPQ